MHWKCLLFQKGHKRLNSSDKTESHASSKADECIQHHTTINVNQTIAPPQTITINGSTVTVPKPTDKEENKDTVDESVTIRKKADSEIDESDVNFSQNRELWQRRANSQSNIQIPTSLKVNRHSESFVQRQNHTPDLVMDLPLLGSCSPKEITKKSVYVSTSTEAAESENVIESPPSLDSPEMQTAAERFAKQNQCTLKKNTKVHIDTTDMITITSPMPDRKYATISGNLATTTFKPQLKSKPPVLKKPVFAVPLPALAADCGKESSPT